MPWICRAFDSRQNSGGGGGGGGGIAVCFYRVLPGHSAAF